MKTLIENGIDESKVHIGSVLYWETKTMACFDADVVSYVKRNEQGEITNIAFASGNKIYSNRHQINIFKTDMESPYKDNGQAIENWYQRRFDGVTSLGEKWSNEDNK